MGHIGLYRITLDNIEVCKVLWISDYIGSYGIISDYFRLYWITLDNIGLLKLGKFCGFLIISDRMEFYRIFSDYILTPRIRDSYYSS